MTTLTIGARNHPIAMTESFAMQDLLPATQKEKIIRARQQTL